MNYASFLSKVKAPPDQEEAAVYMVKVKNQAFRKKKLANPAVYGHPVWKRRFEFPELKDGEGLTPEEVDKFREVYAMADPSHAGFLGHRQFTDMLSLLNIDVEEETLKLMFSEMDENDDNEIDFYEFVPCMVKYIGASVKILQTNRAKRIKSIPPHLIIIIMYIEFMQR